MTCENRVWPRNTLAACAGNPDGPGEGKSDPSPARTHRPGLTVRGEFKFITPKISCNLLYKNYLDDSSITFTRH